MNAGSVRTLLACVMVMSVAAPAAPAQTTINFQSLPQQVVGELAFDDVTIHAVVTPGVPGSLNITGIGLGVSGGFSGNVINEQEAVIFTFDSLVTDLSYHVPHATSGGYWLIENGRAYVTAYDRDNNPITTWFTSGTGAKPYSAVTGNVPLRRLVIQADRSSHSIGWLSFATSNNVYWHGETDAQWDHDNWLGAIDASRSVFLDPLVGRVIHGPADTTRMRNLTIATRNTGITTLQLQQGMLQVAQTLTVANRGRLAGAGAIHAAQLVNEGEVDLDNADLTGSTFTNRGMLRGDGRIEHLLTNESSGAIRVDAGDRLHFTLQTGGTSHINAGEVRLLGGEIEFRHAFTNRGGIQGHGTITAHASMQNETAGTIDLAGESHVIGAVTNAGAINVHSNSTTYFFDHVTQNGQLTIHAGGVAHFLGGFSGSGAGLGEGGLVFSSTVEPGNSPGVASFENDATLTGSAVLRMELAGLEAGTQYDQFMVRKTLTLGGTLEVLLIDGHTAGLGDRYHLLAWGDRVGTFDAIVLPELTDGLTWSTAELYTAGTLMVNSGAGHGCAARGRYGAAADVPPTGGVRHA